MGSKLRKFSSLWLTIAAAFLTFPAFAADSFIVAHDGSVKMPIEILRFDEATIWGRSEFGEHTFNRVEIDCLGKGCPPLEGAKSVKNSLGQFVTLSALEGLFEMTVEIIRFDEEQIIALSNIGEFSVSRSNVICLGEACPLELTSPGSSTNTSTQANQNPTGQVGETPARGNDGQQKPDTTQGNCQGDECSSAKLVQSQTTGLNGYVTLTTKVGGIEIFGQMIARTDDEYVIWTPTGEFRIQVDVVTCSGSTCSELSP